MLLKDRKEHYLKLTLAVYRVTNLFPEGDFLRQEIRKTANKILADLIWSNPHPRTEGICEGIESLGGLFDQAEAKSLVDPRNFSVLRREYAGIRDYVQNSQEPENQPPLFNAGKTVEKSFSDSVPKKGGNGRKRKILDILKNKERIKVGELVQAFPQISRRTLIRDMEELYRGGQIIRTGSGRGANYSIRL